MNRERRWVTVVSPTLTGNAVLRSHALIRLLSSEFNVQVVGFDRSASVYPPLAHDQTMAGALRYYGANLFTWWWQLRRLRSQIRGDVIFAVKPMLGSFGAALLFQRWLRKPLVLDIDDWEIGFLSSAPYWEARSWRLRWLFASDSPLHIRVLDGFSYRASAITVSNSFLQAVYGGHWIPHSRDEQLFRPASATATNAKKTVLFCGSPRGNKGLPALLRVWRRLARNDAVLRLDVPDRSDQFLVDLRPHDVPNVIVTGPHPFEEIPQVLAEADIICVPQDNVRASVGQLPAKLIDAMAVGKMIVATDVGDAARWLANGAGIIVTPGSDDALAEGLSHALDHPEMWNDAGARARERFLSMGSDRVTGSHLNKLVRETMDGRVVPPRNAFDERKLADRG